MTSYVCETCGTEYPAGPEPPPQCPICVDDRQYVGLSGQKWTTLDVLQAKHHNEFEELEPQLFAIRTVPPFAINQRAILLKTAEGNILWDCIALLDEATTTRVRELGGIRTIAISHPHYYTTMGRWSEALGGIPIYLHEADCQHVVNLTAAVRYWSGETLKLHDGVTLIRCGGHFEGGSVLHWPAGADGMGVLLSGDTIQVVPDRRSVSFMYSYPNLVPLNAASVRRIVAAVEPFAFERVYGAFHQMQVEADGKNAVMRSAERYTRHISDQA